MQEQLEDRIVEQLEDIMTIISNDYFFSVVEQRYDLGPFANHINYINRYGFTILMLFTLFGNEHYVNEVLKMGANPDIKNSYVASAPNKLTFYNYFEIILRKYHIYNSYGYTCLMIATASDNVNIVRLLMSSKADPNILNKCNMTALMTASYTDNYQMVLELLLAGVDPNFTIIYEEDIKCAITEFFKGYSNNTNILIELVCFGALIDIDIVNNAKKYCYNEYLLFYLEMLYIISSCFNIYITKHILNYIK